MKIHPPKFTLPPWATKLVNLVSPARSSDKLDLSIVHSMSLRYVIALMLVAVLSTSAWISLSLVISAQKNTAAVVNISGRQRMLSQRTALLANLLMTAPSAEQPVVRAKLHHDIALMIRSHHGLTHGDQVLGLPDTMSPSIRAMYFDAPVLLDRQVMSYTSAIEAWIEEDDNRLKADRLQSITKAATGPLVTALDQMVHQYQQEGEAAVGRLEQAETIFWFATLLLLVLEAALIFRPFIRYVKKVIEKLQIVTEEMRLHQEHLEELVRLRTADLRVAATAFEAQEGMLVTDASCQILRVNRSFTNITGYEEAEVIGKSPSLLNSGRQDAEFYTLMWESINTTGAWEGEIWNRRKNGEVYPEYLTITAVKDSNGNLTNYVATLADITMSKAAVDEIRSLAFYDTLTNLPNRRLLLDRLMLAVASSARNHRKGALLFIDLDNFKTLNDTLGHDVGDLLLRQVGERLCSIIREGDTAARLGGDEFVVMLEDLSTQELEAAAQAEMICQKVLAVLNQPYQLGTLVHHNTPSIGVTMISGHEVSIEELLKQADIAMYQAKSGGRNTMRFFDPTMQAGLNIRVQLEHELRVALEKNQFQLYYQVQVDGSGYPIGAEALIRWQHPEHGMVSPLAFIPLAEEIGLILPIGKWVLEQACSQLHAWQDNPLVSDLVLAVNVSARQFHQADFVSEVQEAMERHAVNPQSLKLELTEGMLLDNIEDTIAIMQALKRVGVRFSLDDFGTGYSSLQYLKRLPLDQLKIDQSFVRDIVADSHDRSIVRTIIAMASSLDLNVIAEGVETEEQRKILSDNGCKHYQGYLFSRPVPLEEFEKHLNRTCT